MRVNQQEDPAELLVPVLFMWFQISMYLTSLASSVFKNTTAQSFTPLSQEKLGKISQGILESFLQAPVNCEIVNPCNSSANISEGTFSSKTFLKLKNDEKFQESFLSKSADGQITQLPPTTRHGQETLHSSVTGSSRSSSASSITAFHNKETLPDEILLPVPLLVPEVASEFTHYVSCSLCNRRKQLHIQHFFELPRLSGRMWFSFSPFQAPIP